MRDNDRALRILAFEPFDTGSHRAVRESISRWGGDEWTWITRPGRAWKWRMRTAAIEMVDDAAQRGLLADAPAGKADPIHATGWDIVFCTSLMSVADLRALVPAAMRAVPLVLYMHENQAVYPFDGGGARVANQEESSGDARYAHGQATVRKPPQGRDAQFALTNLASILAADAVIWNSAWNRDSFIAGIQDLLRHAPDGRVGDIAERIGAKSTVVWPPVEMVEAAGGAMPAVDRDRVLHNPARVVWPHRWEHDKGPDELLAIARCWTGPLNLRWTILGESFRRVPPAMRTFQHEFADRIDHIGYEPDRQRYLQRLTACDWVLSTARHEFFGLAVAEALLCGCLPWLPDRLSYPELLAAAGRGLSPQHPPTDPPTIRRAIADHLSPAIAPHAVHRLEDLLREALRRARGRTSRSSDAQAMASASTSTASTGIPSAQTRPFPPAP